MISNTSNRKQLLGALCELPIPHRIAFAASCAERLLPHYFAFSSMEHWGDHTLLRSTLDEVWHFLASGVSLSPEHLEELEMRCRRVVPDMDEFSSCYASAALDAGAAILNILECCRNGNAQLAAEVAGFACTTIEMFLWQLTDDDVQNHPWMVREAQKQREDLELLRNQLHLTADFITSFRAAACVGGRSTLDLPCF